MSELQVSLRQFKDVRLCLLNDGRPIFRTEYKPGWLIYQSFGYEKSDYGDMKIRPHVSFLADGGNGVAAEWEPQYGPIQVWTECGDDWRGKTPAGNDIQPRKHWHYEYVEDNGGAWSQMAVDREGLREKLGRGDIDGVFHVLDRWARRDD